MRTERWFQVTPGQYRMLHLLLTQGSSCMGDIAATLHVSAPAVTKTVRTLERRGLVLRRPDAGDHRRVLISLSEVGRKAIEKVHRELREVS